MKKKTIKAIIKKKVDAWVASIEDENVRNLVAKNTIVTGGCIVSMLLREPVNDFDVYFRTKEAAKAVAQYYVERFKIQKKKGIPCRISVEDHPKDPERIRIVVKSAGIASEEGTDKPYEYFEGRPEGEATDYVDSIITDPGDAEELYEETKEAARQVPNEDGKPPFRAIFLSTNAITLAGKIQVVIRFFGEPDEIHKNYDYVHCTNYWTSWDENLVLRQPALEAIFARELTYVGSKYPLCSIFRIRKFIKRGWTINAGQILKICMQLNSLDLTNIEVLQDQLTGVDCAYFLEVMHKLKEDHPEKVNSAYLIEIIDHMF